MPPACCRRWTVKAYTSQQSNEGAATTVSPPPYRKGILLADIYHSHLNFVPSATLSDFQFDISHSSMYDNSQNYHFSTIRRLAITVLAFEHAFHLSSPVQVGGSGGEDPAGSTRLALQPTIPIMIP